MSLEAKDLVKRLQSFGLDPGEASVYFHLSRLGGGRAAEVANAAKRKRPDTYRLLDSLVLKGFVEKTLERPTRYMPVEAETALGRLLDARQRETRDLEDERRELTQLWPKAHAQAGPTHQRFTVFQGRDQVQGLIGRMLRAATDEVTLVASPGGLASLGVRPLLQSLEGKTETNVRIRLLTKPEAQRHEVLDDLAGVAEIRFAELPSYHQMVIVDSKEIALFVSGGRKLSTQGEEETVLWLNSPDFVMAQKALFDEVWATGLAHEERLAAEREDRLPVEVRMLRGRWQRLDRMRRMAARARGRIWIVAPAQEFTRWTKAGVRRALEQRAAAGVDVWVWSDGDIDVAGATTIRLDGPPVATQVLVDGRESLTVFGVRDAADAVAFDGERAIWSTHRDQAALLEAAFAALPEARPVVKMADRA